MSFICCLIKFLHWKLKRFVLAPKSDFRSKSDSAPSGAIWAQFRPKQLTQSKCYFCPRWGLFQPLGPNQPEIIRLYCNWFKGAKLDSKIGLYFTHRNGPISKAKRSGSFWFFFSGLKIDTSCNFVRWNLSAIFISLIIIIVRRRRMIKRYRVFWFAENIKSA